MANIIWKTKQQVDLDNLEKLWQLIRTKRDRLLQETDFTQLPDAPYTEQEKQEIAVYRQSLRDVPENCDPNNPIWPTKPEYLTTQYVKALE